MSDKHTMTPQPTPGFGKAQDMNDGNFRFYGNDAHGRPTYDQIPIPPELLSLANHRIAAVQDKDGWYWVTTDLSTVKTTITRG